MKTGQLADAYEEFLAVVQSITASGPLSTRVQAQIDLTLAHVFLADRALVLVARQVLAGDLAQLDNGDAMSRTVLGNLIAGTSHAERVTAVRQEMRTLLRLLRAIPQEAADIAVTVRLVDHDSEQIFQEGLRWGDLIEVRAQEHVPGHSRLLAELLARERPAGG
ncbi:hypothetical protein POF50_007035 [Streptomyces sp. SL13]|uniref:Uncharacterized protein n=1 Tax=Streptantibioticus silvisoli TaxID=2705255 RepID=A0AA90H1V2_9ACTN|nr:hypothetical protein [Streptantibioticus silvisoli]MDI5966375.1 hypothetical protein [Streptantibioticus silvisoli]MDI5969100.1 hypothetical protein [Streptantibioticus silvisoli]